MEDILSFGAWLKQRRNELGYTQQELASLSGCSPATIRKIEAGERKPSRQIAELLVQSLDVPVSEHEVILKWARAQRGLEPQALASLERAGKASENGVAHVSPPMHNTNLPASLTPLIGRDTEVNDLCARLLNADVRLLTLTGPGGIGKTRLATEVASRLVDNFRDGVFFVALAPISDPTLVAPARSWENRHSRTVDSMGRRCSWKMLSLTL